jgi:hypothetical protein
MENLPDKPVRKLPKAAEPPVAYPGAVRDSDRAKRPPLIWSDPVKGCPCVGLFLSLSSSLFVSFFEDRASSSRGRFERRLINLIFAGRNRIIMIRRELPLTSVASPAEPVA